MVQKNKFYILKYIFSMLLIPFGLATNAQVGIGTANPHPSAYLDVDSLPVYGKWGFFTAKDCISTVQRHCLFWRWVIGLLYDCTPAPAHILSSGKWLHENLNINPCSRVIPIALKADWNAKQRLNQNRRFYVIYFIPSLLRHIFFCYKQSC